MRLLEYGNVPVPQTTQWGRESALHIARCPYAKAPALCQPTRQGETGDRPVFGQQHFNRQRRAAYLGLCDLCGRPLKGHTKYSLSEPFELAGRIVQIEPLLHRECADISLGACPHLRASKPPPRRVTSYRVVAHLLPPEIVAEQVPGYSSTAGVVGYALIEVLAAA